MSQKTSALSAMAGFCYMETSMIQAGSTVYHRPTEEEWFVLGVNQACDKLCVAGWPPTIAYIADCELVNTPVKELTPKEIAYRVSKFGAEWQ